MAFTSLRIGQRERESVIQLYSCTWDIFSFVISDFITSVHCCLDGKGMFRLFGTIIGLEILLVLQVNLILKMLLSHFKGYVSVVGCGLSSNQRQVCLLY